MYIAINIYIYNIISNLISNILKQMTMTEYCQMTFFYQG